jgi:hypothetical protein
MGIQVGNEDAVAALVQIFSDIKKYYCSNETYTIEGFNFVYLVYYSIGYKRALKKKGREGGIIYIFI